MTIQTIALLVTLAASPDAGPAPNISAEGLREANLELDAIAAMANPPQRQVILSAILCDAQARIRDIQATIEDGRLSRSLVRAEQSAERDRAQARREMAAHDVLPLTCTEFETARLVTCLDAAAPFWCVKDSTIQVNILAAENLMESWRPRPANPWAKDAGADGTVRP